MSDANAGCDHDARSDNHVIFDDDRRKVNVQLRVGSRFIRVDLTRRVRQNRDVRTEMDAVAEFDAPVGPYDVVRSDLAVAPAPEVAKPRSGAAAAAAHDGSIMNHQSNSWFERIGPKNEDIVAKSHVGKAAPEP